MLRDQRMHDVTATNDAEQFVRLFASYHPNAVVRLGLKQLERMRRRCRRNGKTTEQQRRAPRAAEQREAPRSHATHLCEREFTAQVQQDNRPRQLQQGLK